jgi:hypothetical protein
MPESDYFSPCDMPTLPPLPEDGTPIPIISAESDFVLMALSRQPYIIVNMKTQQAYMGNERLLDYLYRVKFFLIHLRFMALDGSWQVDFRHRANVYFIMCYGEGFKSAQEPFYLPQTQAEIEHYAKSHRNMHLMGDGEKDWLFYAGKDNPARSYIVCHTDAYLLLYRKNEAGTFDKYWELYGGIQLTGGLIRDGILRANEGYGINDASEIRINAQTGDIIECERGIRESMKLVTYWGYT